MDKKLLTSDRRIIKLSDIEGKNRLRIFDRIGLESKYTDFAYSLGGDVIDNKTSYQVNPGKENISRFYVKGNTIIGDPEDQYYIAKGIRVVTNLPYSKENEIQTDEDGIPFVLYGEYPQTVATKKQDYLISEVGLRTGDNYITSNLRAFCKRIESPKDFMRFIDEYNLDGDKFARMTLDNVKEESIVFSTGREFEPYNKEDYSINEVSFKVEPIKWYVDEKTGLLVSEKILSTSVPYDYLVNHKDNVKRLTKKNKKN